MNKFSQITLIASLVALTACASAPKRVAELDAARVEYETVASDPLAREAAASRLETAQQRLRQADAALADQAQVDADLAGARARHQTAKKAAAEVQAGTETLRQEVNRQQPTQ